jgi:hypothetical protein
MLGNWIKQATNSTTNSSVSLTTIPGYIAFNDWFGIAPARKFGYVVQDVLSTTSTNWEAGLGHLSSSTVLQRDTIISTVSSGVVSHGGAALTLSGAGSTFVYCDTTADDFRAPGWNGANTSTAGVSILHHGTNTNAYTLSANTFACWAVYIPVSGVYSGIRHHFSASAGTKMEWGLYQVKTDGTPGELLCRTGDIVPGNGDITTSWTGGNIYLREGWYYMAWSGDGTCGVLAGNIYGMHYYGPMGCASTGQPNNVATNPVLINPLTDPCTTVSFSQQGGPYIPINQFIKV